MKKEKIILVLNGQIPKKDELKSFIKQYNQIICADGAANEIIKSLDNGSDFVEIAKEKSISSNAQSGGLLNWRKAVDMPELFEKALVDQSIGFISEPLESGA